MALSHRVTYQGFKARAVKYRRTDGLTAETGYVDLPVSDLGNLKITMPGIPWRKPNGGKEIPGQLGIDQAWRKYSGEMSGHQTVVQGQEKGGKGFNLVGNLVMESFDGGKSLGKLVYSEVYVAFEGIEELTERLAFAKRHDEGFIRVVLSDSRQFYNDYGLLFQNINCTLRSGVYDPRTVQKGGNPWPLEKVIPFLFGQLPGSPTVHPSSDIFSMSGNPPTEIIGEGEPVVGVLQDILNNYGLVAKFMPDGNSFLVVKKWEGKVSPGRISTSPGATKKWNYLKTEKKSTNGTNRPPLVCVKGRRRVQRVTIPYVPVVQWTDGRYYQLDDIGSLIPGYDINRVNIQVMNGEGKNFLDVIPLSSSGAVGSQWMQILRKWAYKGYAPCNAFSEVPNPSLQQTPQGFVPTVQGQQQKKTLHAISDEDFEFLPFLPAVEAPFYKSDLALQGLDILFKGKSSKKSTKGDQDGIVLLPPIVKSRHIGETWFQDSAELGKYIAKIANSYGKEKEYADARVQIAQDRGQSLVDHVNASAKNWPNALEVAKLRSNPRPVLEIDQETRQAAKGFGVFEDGISAVIDDFGLGVPIRAALIAINQELERWKKEAKEADEALRKALKDANVYQAVFAAYRGFAAIGNLPVSVAERGKYSLDPESGIVLFAEPQCRVEPILCMADEFRRVVGDGAVSVTFGYEHRFNGISDWTTVYIAPDDNGPGRAAGAAVVGVCRPSGIKAKIERAPDLTMYLDEYGNPMNITNVIDAAVRKAQFQVSMPDAVQGYESVYHGFVPCVLDSGINCVQHAWESNRPALTYVFQNYHGGAGPLGPAMVPTQSAAEGRARNRATMEELKER